jgi:hypothetical protein
VVGRRPFLRPTTALLAWPASRVVRSNDAPLHCAVCCIILTGTATIWNWIGAGLFSGVPVSFPAQFTVHLVQLCGSVCAGGTRHRTEPPIGVCVVRDTVSTHTQRRALRLACTLTIESDLSPLFGRCWCQPVSKRVLAPPCISSGRPKRKADSQLHGEGTGTSAPALTQRFQSPLDRHRPPFRF